MFRRGRCFGAADVSVRSMLRCGRCFGAVDAYMNLLNFKIFV